ncbi:1090_t:CDS:2 [Diversispora eburnea]|uniref:1090_t:CDS:1 n=1 Tax=Diversispora eburnea TaxID=1213867 RepID=A0A9N9FQN7_9GLOM|nr:1090_t:CDS:2 [Diversispora eburnea]
MLWSYLQATFTTPGYSTDSKSITEQREYDEYEELRSLNLLNSSNSEGAIFDLDLNFSFLILIGAIFGLCLIGFTIFHTSLILSNQTTLESIIKHNYRLRRDVLGPYCDGKTWPLNAYRYSTLCDSLFDPNPF